MNSKWRVAKCPYCGHYDYYKPIGASDLNKMSEHLKIDMTWDGTIHCTNCTRDFKITLLTSFFAS